MVLFGIFSSGGGNGRRIAARPLRSAHVIALQKTAAAPGESGAAAHVTARAAAFLEDHPDADSAGLMPAL